MTRMRLARFFGVVAAVLILVPGTASGQESATVTLPPSVSFSVQDVATSTTGVPTPMRAEFNDAVLLPDRAVRISVMADAASFTAGSTTFAASRVSWTISGTEYGVGFSGTLSASSWTPVFQGNGNATRGAVEMRWNLDAPGRTRAGTHTLGLHWKIESVTP